MISKIFKSAHSTQDFTWLWDNYCLSKPLRTYENKTFPWLLIQQTLIQSNQEVKGFFFYLMLAKQKGKITTSKDHKNLWSERISQKATDLNTQVDKSRLSHLSKNPMKEKSFRKNFQWKRKIFM